MSNCATGSTTVTVKNRMQKPKVTQRQRPSFITEGE